MDRHKNDITLPTWTVNTATTTVATLTIPADQTVSNVLDLPVPAAITPAAGKTSRHELALVPVELLQHPITGGTGTPPVTSGPIRFCRWIDAYPNGIRDNQFADHDRDRFQIRIPGIVPAITKIKIKATELHGAVINGAFQNKTTDGDYEVDMTQVNGAMISEPILLVSDGDDDVTFNGKGTDNGKNDQTLLADFGSTITVTFPQLANGQAIFKAQQPIATVTLDIVYCHSAAAGAPPLPVANIPGGMITLMELQTRKMEEIYRQIGIKVNGLTVSHTLAFPEDWLVANGETDPVNTLNDTQTFNLNERIKLNIAPANKIRVGFTSARLTAPAPDHTSVSGIVLNPGADPCLVSLDGDDANRLNILAHEAGHVLNNRHFAIPDQPNDHWLMRFAAGSKWSDDSLAAKRWWEGDADHMKKYSSPSYYVPTP